MSLEICEICWRQEKLTRHHLVPLTRLRHERRKNGKFDVNKVVIAQTCQPCHDKVHSLFSEKELEKDYNTIEKIRAHPDMQLFIQWVKKQRTGRRIYSAKRR